MTPLPEFSALKFRYDWREYQRDVLNDLETHLEDEKLHVIAAPGAGKTVLGLEIMRRIGQPTLVLTPSLAIRNQWVDRLVELFVPDQEMPDWVSTDLHHPGLFTVATYQALHTGCDPNVLEAAGIKTLVVDEAHHLRRAWWEALQKITKQIDLKTIALTATPPYDVASAEWQRYESFCGPVDAEISIPELVKTNDLAPHQDLIHLSQPDAQESGNLNKIAVAAADIFDRVRADPDLLALLENHDWITKTREDTKDILDHPELFSAMLIYLNDAKVEIPEYGLRVLGVGQTELPPLDVTWLECLLEGLLDHLPPDLVANLRKARVLYGKRIKLNPADRTHLILERSRGKLESVAEITRRESKAMGDGLRLLILTDFIREELMPKPGEKPDLSQLAVVPIFEMLRTDRSDLGVLTGSLLIVPAGCLKAKGVTATALKHDPRYETLNLSGIQESARVELLTDLFTKGDIRVLIGTRALLGQGWDMPALNTLILASKVSSFISSNQMRGRAIRKNPDNPDKAANIWHLATVTGPDFGPEYDMLARRFDTFQGLNVETGKITSGLPEASDSQMTIDARNSSNFIRMTEREKLPKLWRDALLAGGLNPRMRRRLETSLPPRRLVQTGFALNAGARIAGVTAPLGIWGLLDGPLLLGGALAIAGVYFLFPVVKDLQKLIKHGTLSSSLQQVGLAVLYALDKAGQMDTAREKLEINAGESSNGYVYCDLEGGSLKDKSRFIAAMNEVLGPIENPRYLVIRESYLGKQLRMAPYSVPTELAKKKDIAQHFQTGWRRYVGPAKLVYTRTVGGRWALLQARNVARVEGRSTRQKTVWE